MRLPLHRRGVGASLAAATLVYGIGVVVRRRRDRVRRTSRRASLDRRSRQPAESRDCHRQAGLESASAPRALRPLSQPAVVREAAMTPTQDRWSRPSWRRGSSDRYYYGPEYRTLLARLLTPRRVLRRPVRVGFRLGPAARHLSHGVRAHVRRLLLSSQLFRDARSLRARPPVLREQLRRRGPAVRLSQSWRRARGHAGSAGAALSPAAHGVPLSHRVCGRLQVQAASVGAAGQGPASRLCARRRQAQGRQGGRSSNSAELQAQMREPSGEARPTKAARWSQGSATDARESAKAGQRGSRNAASEAELMRLGTQPRAGAREPGGRQQQPSRDWVGDLWKRAY